MKYGLCQTINNTVCYYQMPFSIALILEQVSNCNNLLREQVNMDKAACIRQNNMISEENTFKSRMSVTANECMPNELDDKNIDNESKITNEDE